jgi:HAD superfamily hydrolase (TIGR01509 family)
MGYLDWETAAILTEMGLLEINHRVPDAGGPFPATLELLVERFPRHFEFIRAFDTRWVESLGGTIPGSVAIFDRLKQAGAPVHALSNYNRQKFDIACKLFPYELVLSGDVGLVKPDAEIFELLIRRCGLDVGRTAFIDDSIANVATAAPLGFATIHFNEKTTDLGGELLRLGLHAEALSQP